MKKRNGFVSNSSSSSFIILGYSVKSDDYEIFEEMEADRELRKKFTFKSYDGNLVFGKLIDEDCCNSNFTGVPIETMFVAFDQLNKECQATDNDFIRKCYQSGLPEMFVKYTEG